MELESILNGNTFLLYFMGLLYLLLKKDFEEKQKIVMIFVFVYSLKLFRILDLKSLMIGLCIVSFLYIEFLSKDNVKNILLCNIFYKFVDYMYKLIFEYSAVHFLLALFLTSDVCKYNLKAIEVWDISIPIIEVNINLISILILIYAITNITSQKFGTKSFTEIKNKMDKIALWNNIKRSSIDTVKLRMLTDIEDKSYFVRENTYSFFSFEFLKYKINRLFKKRDSIKNNLQLIEKKELFKLKNIKKLKKHIRGYSTIEMQIIRTLGIEYGFEKHILCRKWYEIIYSKLFFTSLRKHMNKSYLDTINCCTFKEYLLMIYIKIAPIKINNNRYNNMLKVWEEKDIIHVSNEQFFISILGLSYRYISMEILYNYSRIISKYSLNKNEIKRLINEFNKE